MMQYPIWSTWARYKTNISQSVVLGYADEILEYGFPNSQLEVDDGLVKPLSCLKEVKSLRVKRTVKEKI